MSVDNKSIAVSAWGLTFRYEMLHRMALDCEYFLGYGYRYEKHLWAGNATDQIEYMKALWLSFTEDQKPEWLTYEKIEDYERRMTV